MRNPFYGYGTIRRGEQLVGRDQDIQIITDYLASYSGNLSIVGEHRIGKTSLTCEIFEKVKNINDHFCYSWMILSVIPNTINVFNEILDGMVESLQERGLDIPENIKVELATTSKDSYEAYKRCRNGLIMLYKLGFNSLLIIDEFDAILQFEDAQGFIRRLRALADTSGPIKTGLSVVFISRRSLIAIEKQLPGISNLDGVCQKHYVSPLDEAGLDAMISRCGNDWILSPEDRETLRWYTGGHPFLSEMILCNGWSAQSTTIGVKKSIAEILDHYRHLRNLLEEDGLFQHLLQAAVGPRWNLDLESVERLTRYGVMQRTYDEEKSVRNEDGNYFQGWSSHFQAYLEKCAREAPYWDVWKQTEITLRDKIEEICSQEFGTEWIDVLQKRHSSMAKAVTECKPRMDKDKRLFGASASDRFLDYTYPMELWEIMNSEWQHFRMLLGKDKRYWKERFDLLSEVRNPSAHNRDKVIPEHKLTQALGYCKELLSILENK